MIDEQYRYIELIRSNQYGVFRNELSVFELRLYDIHGSSSLVFHNFHLKYFFLSFIFFSDIRTPFRLDTLYNLCYVSVIECRKSG